MSPVTSLELDLLKQSMQSRNQGQTLDTASQRPLEHVSHPLRAGLHTISVHLTRQKFPSQLHTTDNRPATSNRKVPMDHQHYRRIDSMPSSTLLSETRQPYLYAFAVLVRAIYTLHEPMHASELTGRMPWLSSAVMWPALRRARSKRPDWILPRRTRARTEVVRD